MKKVLIILFTVVLFSCKKDPTCYKCTTTFTITYKDSQGIYTWDVSDTRTKCDVTESEIREYEINNSDTVTYTNGELSIDTLTLTVCKK
jgi:hypothetical protein